MIESTLEPAVKRARKVLSIKDIVTQKNGITKNSTVILLMVGALIAGSVVTYAFTSNSQSITAAPISNISEITTGKVGLTEIELISAVKELGIDVYWTGPVKAAKYTLAVPSKGQAFIRYLPNGQGLTDTKPNYLVIATYATTNAFDATQSAGNQSNGVTFINTQGAAVYYNKVTPNNVYVAFPNLDYQIEIFSPVAATALTIASNKNSLRLIK